MILVNDIPDWIVLYTEQDRIVERISNFSKCLTLRKVILEGIKNSIIILKRCMKIIFSFIENNVDSTKRR